MQRWREDKMGGGGGRGGRKFLDWPEGVFPRRAIGHPIVSSLWSDPSDALSPRMGFCAPMIFPWKFPLKKVWPEGVFPRRAIGHELDSIRIKLSKEINFKNQKTKGRHHQTNNQRTKRRTISQDHQRPSSDHNQSNQRLHTKKSREAFSKRKIWHWKSRGQMSTFSCFCTWLMSPTRPLNYTIFLFSSQSCKPLILKTFSDRLTIVLQNMIRFWSDLTNFSDLSLWF